MVEIKQFKGELFAANTYIITSPQSKGEVYLVDCGSFQEIIDSFEEPFFVKGIFITHYHYDHIFNLEQWQSRFPDLIVYGSEITKLGIASSKKNLSFYHDNSISLDIKKYKVLYDEDEIELWQGVKIKYLETEGHCEGSSTFIYNKYLFTGDALIPNAPVVTKLKTGNKSDAKISVQKIKSFCSDGSFICPGHLNITSFSEVKWESYESI